MIEMHIILPMAESTSLRKLNLCLDVENAYKLAHGKLENVRKLNLL
jgi:hypothetical protein